MEEEKKPLPESEGNPDSAPENKEETLDEDLDGFADEIVLPEPEPVEEEKPAEEECAIGGEQVPEFEDDEPEEEEPPLPEPEESPTPDLDYDDPDLAAIEEARKTFRGAYKKTSRIKFAYSSVIVIGILAGFLLPNFLMHDAGMIPLGIGVGVAAVGIGALALIGHLQRKHDHVGVQNYFTSYYNALHSYTLKKGLGIEDIQGTVDDKITKDEFIEGGAFDELNAVGSRDNIVFKYKGMDCALVDASAQVDGGKSLRTVFVGKYLRTHNNLDFLTDEGLLIYFPGNDRALPPEKMDKMHLLEKKKHYRVYGNVNNRRAINKEFRDFLSKVRTDKLLVDVTIVIKSGRTYWYLGYEDDLMVLPTEKPFDARFTKEYREQIALILDGASILNRQP